MTNLDLFKIRNITSLNNKDKKSLSTYIYGVDAVIELIKQRCLIIRNELWWDYNYGLDIQNLNTVTLYFWIRTVLNGISYVTMIRDIQIKIEKNKYVVSLSLQIDNTIDVDEKLSF